MAGRRGRRPAAVTAGRRGHAAPCRRRPVGLGCGRRKAGLLGRGRRHGDVGERVASAALAAQESLLDAAVRRLGRPAETRDPAGPGRARGRRCRRGRRPARRRSGTASTPASGRAAWRRRPGFVVDHARCPVLLVWPATRRRWRRSRLRRPHARDPAVDRGPADGRRHLPRRALPRPPLPDVHWSTPERWIVKVRPLGHVAADLVDPLLDALRHELDGAPAVECRLGPATVRPGGQWLCVPVRGWRRSARRCSRRRPPSSR